MDFRVVALYQANTMLLPYNVTCQRCNELELELKRDADASVCYSEYAHIFPESRSTNAKISGNNAVDKVYSFPIFLDVFLLFYIPGRSHFIACGQSWNVLQMRRLLTSWIMESQFRLKLLQRHFVYALHDDQTNGYRSMWGLEEEIYQMWNQHCSTHRSEIVLQMSKSTNLP